MDSFILDVILLSTKTLYIYFIHLLYSKLKNFIHYKSFMWTTRLPCFSCLLLFMLFLLIFTDIKVPHSLTRIHLCVSSLQFHGMWGVWYQIVNLKKFLICYI